MEDVMIRESESAAVQSTVAGWKTGLSHFAAIVMGIVFLVSGGYKILMPLDFAERATQVLIPANLSVATAVILAITETFAAIMLLIPRYRRFGTIVMLAMLAAFCIYIGVNFERLQGEDCSCFPWVKRTVGPLFFISNAVMAALAFVAGWWSPRAGSWFPPKPLKGSLAVLGVLTLLSVGSAAYAVSTESGLEAPATIAVNGKRVSLQAGPVFLYLFDPECAHCLQSARMMSTWDFGATRVIAVPTVNPQWGQDLLNASGFKAELATDPEDVKALREIFEFASPPYGVALKRGHARMTIRYAEFDEGLKARMQAEGFVARE